MAKKHAEDHNPPKDDANWEFNADETPQTQPDQATTQVANQPVSANWTASEYMHHDKSTTWFIGLGLAGAVIGALIYLITQEFVTTILTMAMVVIFGVFAARKPQEFEYTIDSHGLQIGPKVYAYNRFKSFAVINEENISSITLLPMTRFMPPISIYYDSKDESSIVNALSAYLPMEQREQDWIERLMHKIGF